jgi:uncharacterized Zn-binding protein involved in type VI secretion
LSNAARIGDAFLCFSITQAGTPHVGGVILTPGMPTVTIGGAPAARVGDVGQCAGGIPNVIVRGASSVFIGDQQAARVADPMAHGDWISNGCPTVTIGDGGASALGEASVTGSPFVRM